MWILISWPKKPAYLDLHGFQMIYGFTVYCVDEKSVDPDQLAS